MQMLVKHAKKSSVTPRTPRKVSRRLTPGRSSTLDFKLLQAQRSNIVFVSDTVNLITSGKRSERSKILSILKQIYMIGTSDCRTKNADNALKHDKVLSILSKIESVHREMRFKIYEEPNTEAFGSK